MLMLSYWPNLDFTLFCYGFKEFAGAFQLFKDDGKGEC